MPAKYYEDYLDSAEKYGEKAAAQMWEVVPCQRRPEPSAPMDSRAAQMNRIDELLKSGISQEAIDQAIRWGQL